MRAAPMMRSESHTKYW